MEWVVYQTIYSGALLPRFYIGSTTLAKYQAGYKGTVLSRQYKGTWLKELQDHPHLFRTVLLARFKSHTEALAYEEELHVKYDVVKNKDYINMAIANRKFSNAGRTHSTETKELMSRGHKGIEPWNKGARLTDKHKENISKGKQGIPSPMKGRKTGRPSWNKDIPMSEETKAIQSAQKKGQPWSEARRRAQERRTKAREIEKKDK